MGILSGIFKLFLFTVFILIASQIRVSDRRICDHVGDIVSVDAIQKPLEWISEKFSYSHSNPKHKDDRAVLSGFLKENVK